MSTRRFLAAPGSLAGAAGTELELMPEEAAHARRVLRLTPGAEIELIDGQGWKARGVLTRVDKAGAACRVEEAWQPPAPAPRLVLCPGLAKGPAMELMLVKLTELMADEIRPFVSPRTVPRFKDAAAKLERWRRLADQALKQCGAARAPRLFAPVDLGEVVTAPPPGALAIMLYEQEQGPTLAQALDDGLGTDGAAGGAAEVWVMVGPEGGFSPEEAETARAAGWRVCGLPGAILRAETAALAAAAVVRLGPWAES